MKCSCYRVLNESSGICKICDIANQFLSYVQEGTLPDIVKTAVKPVVCVECYMRFSDVVMLNAHKCGRELEHTEQNVNPSTLSIQELKIQLQNIGLPVSGNKDVLRARLEDHMM